MRNLLFLLVRRSALCAIAAFLVTSVHAQGLTSSGTDFWVGFYPNEDAPRDILLTELYLASTSADTALVTYDGSTYRIPLAANSVATIDLASRGITDTSELPMDRSVHVQTHSPITVYGFDDVYNTTGGVGGSPDGYLAIPTSSLGTEYYTMNYTEYDNFAGMEHSQFLVIAPYDSTIVTITTRSHTRGPKGNLTHNPGDTWSVMLMRGQSYLVQSSGQYSTIDDLTGSHVVGSKPIAMFSGHQMADIPLSQNSADYLIEMLPSCDRWGTEYYEMPMAGRQMCGDYIRILSAEDGNIITANGKTLATLNRGDWIADSLVRIPTVYRSANGKRFLAAEYAYSNHYHGDTAEIDPFYLQLVGPDKFESSILFRTPPSSHGPSYAHFLTILAPPTEMKNIIINGKAANAYPIIAQTAFPNSTIGAMQIRLPNGSNSYLATSSTTLFGMYQYGYTNYEGYGWPAGLALGVKNTDSLPPAQSAIATCGRYDVTISETRRAPEYPFTDSRIAELAMITQNGDPRWAKPSFNYKFTPVADFHSGDSMTHFTLEQIDPAKPAYAAVLAIDVAGNDTVYEYFSPSIGGATFEHREMTSGVIYHQVTLPLSVTMTDTSLRSSWGAITSMTASIAYDPSELTYVFYYPPTAWRLASAKALNGILSIALTNNGSSYSQPMSLGSAVFTVQTPNEGTSLVTLSALDLKMGSRDNALCISGNEDATWAVIIQHGVASVDAPQVSRIAVHPNPFGDHLIVDDPQGDVTSVEIYDALGRLVLTSASLDIQTSSLAVGAYLVVCHATEGIIRTMLTKTH